MAVQPIWRDSVRGRGRGRPRADPGRRRALAAPLAARWSCSAARSRCGCRPSATRPPMSRDTTSAAIQVMLNGGDPYGLGYAVSRPAGAAFPYGPVALLWYLPSSRDPALIEFVVSVSASEGTRNVVSPSIPSACRLVARMRRPGRRAAGRRRARRTPRSGARSCPAPAGGASIRRALGERRHQRRPASSRTPSTEATACGTSVGSASAASSTSQTPSG